MCYTAKASVTAWWILAMMSLFIWYRNERFDRALAVFIFALALIQLIEYGVHSGVSPSQAGQALFLTLWLQCLVLAIGVFVFIKGARDADETSTRENVVSLISGWNLALFAIVFLAAIIYSFTLDFSASPGPSGHIEWYANGGPLLGGWGWIYLLGVFGALLLLFAFYNFADLPLGILILYGLLSFAYIARNFERQAFTSMWCYLSVGFAFLVWFLGIIPSCQGSSRC